LQFPSPDISSVSYFSNGKTLNSTIWLTNRLEGLSSNKTLSSSSPFVNYLPVYQSYPSSQRQAFFLIYISDAKGKNLNETVNDLIKNYKGNYTDFHIYSNESNSNTTLAGNPAYKLVYTYTSNQSLHLSPCKTCKESA
jgi:hypothetical protein